MSPIRFGTDGWRDVIADGFTVANVARVTQAVADTWQDHPQRQKGCIVGYDTRFLSRRFAETAAGVLAANGVPVFLGVRDAPTPAVSWAVHQLGLVGGIMITASHNPPEYNGLKLKADFAGSALPEMTEAVEQRFHSNVQAGHEPRTMAPADARQAGLLSDYDPRESYLTQLRNYVDLEKIGRTGWRVVVDTMHGAGYGYLGSLLREAGLAVEEVRADPRADLGGIAPEPLARNLRPTRARVIETAAIAGLCLDGDADRLAAVDETGQVLDAHRIFALLLRHLHENRGLDGSVIKTYAATRMVQRLAERYGLVFRETPVGFKHVCRYALSETVLIGGEESGGLGVRDHIPERDGILCNLLLLEMMAERDMTLSQLIEETMEQVGWHHFDRVDLHLAEKDKEALLERLATGTPNQLAGMRVTSEDRLDGVKLTLGEDGWVLFRPSGTEPVVRIYVEADTPAKVRALVGEATALARGEA